MKKLNKIAKRITAYDAAIDKFIQECEESDRFNNKQIEEICDGFDEGLTMEQVEVYAKPEFDDYQMYEIRKGFINGLSMEEVKLYANPEFNDGKMEKIRRNFENGLIIEEVKEKYNL